MYFLEFEERKYRNHTRKKTKILQNFPEKVRKSDDLLEIFKKSYCFNRNLVRLSDK